MENGNPLMNFISYLKCSKKEWGALASTKGMARKTSQIKAPSRQCVLEDLHFRTPPFIYDRPHENDRKGRFSKREVRQNGGLQKRFWTWRLLKTKVYRSRRVDGENEGFRKCVMSYGGLTFRTRTKLISRVYGFWTPNMRIRTKKWSVHSKSINKNVSLDLSFQSLVWTAEYDVKRLVWTRMFLSVFWDP